ncbi:hypothetical protein [Actinoallomurus acanthiterrae]
MFAAEDCGRDAETFFVLGWESPVIAQAAIESDVAAAATPATVATRLMLVKMKLPVSQNHRMCGDDGGA